jgi:hypothetical protein
MTTQAEANLPLLDPRTDDCGAQDENSMDASLIHQMLSLSPALQQVRATNSNCVTDGANALQDFNWGWLAGFR